MCDSAGWSHLVAKNQARRRRHAHRCHTSDPRLRQSCLEAATGSGRAGPVPEMECVRVLLSVLACIGIGRVAVWAHSEVVGRWVGRAGFGMDDGSGLHGSGRGAASAATARRTCISMSVWCMAELVEKSCWAATTAQRGTTSSVYPDAKCAPRPRVREPCSEPALNYLGRCSRRWER